MDGWIKLHRKFLEWEWFDTDNMVKLFIYLLLSANHTPQKWRGETIGRGQILTGRQRLSEKLRISERNIRTCLSRLEKTGELTIKTTSKYSIITLCNYDTYQTEKLLTDQQSDQQPTSNRPATDQQPTTNKNDKKDKKVKNERNSLKEVTMLWDDEEFFHVWEFWKKYKQEQFRFKYKSTISEQGALSKLYELSGGKLETAMLIIKQSIQNGWQGLFELKGEFKNKIYDREQIFADLQAG